MSSYILLLELEEPVTIDVGGLGKQCFPAGYYAYVGSAIRNPDSRLMRHLRSSKKKRWHVDYLREMATIKRIHLYAMDECTVNESLKEIPGFEIATPGFGSSDCPRCVSHLAYFRDEPDLSTLSLWSATDTRKNIEKRSNKRRRR